MRLLCWRLWLRAVLTLFITCQLYAVAISPELECAQKSEFPERLAWAFLIAFGIGIALGLSLHNGRKR